MISYEIAEIFVQGCCCKQFFFHSKSKRLTSKQILIKCMKFERPHAVSVVPARARGLHQTIRNIKQTLFCKILNICCAPLFVKLNLILVKYSQFPRQTNFPFWANCCNGKVLTVNEVLDYSHRVIFFQIVFLIHCDVVTGHRMHLEQCAMLTAHCKV